MWRIAPPETGTREAFRLCLSAKVSSAKLTLLTAYEDRVVSAAEAYEQACRSAALHELDPADYRPDECRKDDADDLVGMYERRMSPNHPGRPVYEEARNWRTKCPLCGVGSVRQVDHHLPKAVFPYLAMVPINLLPICADCNYTKLAQVPNTYEEQTLHPYFDDVDGERWLKARLVTEFRVGHPPGQTSVASPTNWFIHFYVAAPASWDTKLAKRVAYHFETFNLAQLYEDQAADEVTGIELSLEEAFQVGGSSDVRSHLTGVARSRRARRQNNWMVALYEALAASDWYCRGGFRYVANG
jgi:hypothetical protein